MIRSNRGLISVGAVTLLLALIIMFPARVAIHWFLPTGIIVSGIQGSVWNGGATEASVGGAYLRDLRWDFNALQLFAGKLSYHVNAAPVAGFLESDVSVGFGGVISLADMTAALPLELFSGISGVRGLQGDASLKFERVEIVDGLAAVADGTIRIANLILPVVSRSSLGGYKAEFFTQNNGIAASIEDTDGVVDLAGSLLIRTDRSFEFIAQVIAKPETPPAVRQQLNFLPLANDRGQRELRLEGIL